MPVLTRFLSEKAPDIVFLQEIKATQENFPFLDFKVLGYFSEINGQKAYNGVAILSKYPLKNILITFPDEPKTDPQQARFIQAETSDLTLICVYVPNETSPANNPSDISRLEYKLKWLNAFTKHIQSLIQQGKSVLIGGDFNVIEKDSDVYNPELFRESALMVPLVRKSFQEFCTLPLINIIRQFNSKEHTYSFWDFQGGAWPRNHGILLDFFFATKNIKVLNTKIYKEIRGWEKTSDHAPIECLL